MSTQPFVPQTVYDIVRSPHTLSSALAENPARSVQNVVDALYPTATRHVDNLRIRENELTEEDLDRVEQCGRFISRPSDLFLKVGFISSHSCMLTPSRCTARY